MRIPWDELSESPAKAEQLFDLIPCSVYGDRVSTTNGAGGAGGIDAWIGDLARVVESPRCTPRPVTGSGSPASPAVTPSR